MVVVFPVWSQTMSRLSTLWMVWRGNREGAPEPLGERKYGECVQFWGRNRRRKDLSPGVTLLPISILLFSHHSD